MRVSFLSLAIKRFPHRSIYVQHLRLTTYASQTRTMSTSAEPPSTLVVPEGYTLHTENSSHILLPNDNGAFLNPVQEFNRDLSVACITVWGEQMNEVKRQKWEQKAQKAQKAESKAKKQKSEFRAVCAV